MSEIINKLTQLYDSNDYPYHMPGHKRNMVGEVMENVYGFDITEIDGFDNLHQPEDLLLEAKKRLENLYRSENSFYLVNGSTVGILAAIISVTNKGETILMARNCHKAVYHAAQLQELETEYLYPVQLELWDLLGGIDSEVLEEKLKQNPNIRAVVITSPTFDGIVSDIESLAKITHMYKIPLIVDEAHGAHFVLHDEFPKSAVDCGADIVIQSLHKTLPSLTQTAILHVNGKIVNLDKVAKYLEIFQTSSPSYILMASMDRCVEIMKNDGARLADIFIHRMKMFLMKMQSLKHIQILTEDRLREVGFYQKYSRLCIPIRDMGKLVISVKSTTLTGQELYEILRLQYGLQLEMASNTYVLAIMTIMDTEEGFIRLQDALIQIDQELQVNEIKLQSDRNILFSHKAPFRKMTIGLAMKLKSHKEIWERCVGEVAGDYLNLYPPDIPLIAPGEMISLEMIEYINKCKQEGLHVQGIDSQGNMLVLN